VYTRALVSAVTASLLASTLVLVAPGGVPEVAATTGPIAEWTFDDGSGTTATDAIGNLDGAIIGGATWITGDVAQGTGALAFDGIDDIVTIADNATLEPESHSITAWVKTQGLPSHQMVVLAKGSNGCEGASYEILHTGREILGQVDTPPSQDSARWLSTPARLNDGAWHHVAYTFDVDTGVGRWFIDGDHGELEMPAPIYGLPEGGDALTIGGITTSCEWYGPFAGAIDDVRLYDRALTVTEINDALPDLETTVTVEWPSNPVSRNQPPNLTVTVSPAPAPFGEIFLQQIVDGTPVDLNLNGLDIDTGVGLLGIVDNLNTGQLLPEGDYELVVHYTGNGIYQPSTSHSQVVQIRRDANGVSLTPSRSTVYPGESLNLLAVADEFTDSFEFWDAHDGAEPTLIGTIAASAEGIGGYRGTLHLDEVALGTHEYTAVAEESVAYMSATSAVATVTATKRPTEPSLGYFGVEQANHPFEITVWMYALDPEEPAPNATGTVTLKDGAATLGEASLIDGQVTFDVPSFTVGTHQISAEYEGDDVFAPSTGSMTLEIAPDTVDVTGVGVEYVTFYPYKDDYRDTVAIRGTRQEPASVAISIYNSDGKRVRTASVGLGDGAWSWAWNGRKGDGTSLAGGKYKVVQVITDAAGTKKSVTSYTTLSKKRLVTKTATFTKDHTQTAKKTQSWLAWNFKLPEATVYSKLTFSIYGRDDFGGGGFGPHDYTECSSSAIHPDCVTRWRTFPTTFKWKSFTANVSEDRSGRNVRLYAWGGFGDTRISRGRVTVTYAILM
jgi:hypothetical protein